MAVPDECPVCGEEYHIYVTPNGVKGRMLPELKDSYDKFHKDPGGRRYYLHGGR